MMRISEHEQGTEEWLAERVGLITASNVSNLISSTGKPSASATGYIDKVVGEILMGGPEETYKNAAMQRGNDLEPEARAWYEMLSGNDVEEVGLCIRDELGAACSPDGLIGDDGGLEIKCLMAKGHVAALRQGKVPSDYVSQVQMCMWITDRQWWDFACYHPTMPKLLLRVERDQEYIDLMATEVAKAKAKIEKNLKLIQEKYS